MHKVVKVGLLSLVGMTMVGSTMVSPAAAASKVKVLSTKKIAKKAFHSTKGNVYSSNKLTHRRYQMKNYKYTTWYTYKRSVLKIGQKHRSYVYIKAGKRAGWIYSKSLKKGKAPAAYRVLATKKLAKTAYHGTSGSLYSTATLKKRTYKLVKGDKYTTWYATKRATVNCKGKKRSYLYVTSANKKHHGWIYQQSLKKGKAPVNQLKNDYLAYNKAAMLASPDTQNELAINYMSYDDMAGKITWNYGGSNQLDDLRSDKKSLLQMYAVFKKHFDKATQDQLNQVTQSLTKLAVTEDTQDKVSADLATVSVMLGTQVRHLADKNRLNAQETLLRNTYLNYNRISMIASEGTQSELNTNTESYDEMGGKIKYSYGGSYQIAQVRADRTSLLMMYDLFKGRFSGNVRNTLKAEAQIVRNKPLNENTTDDVSAVMETFSKQLGEQVQTLR